MNELLDEIRAEFHKALQKKNREIPDINPETLLADLGLDSLDQLDIIFHIEEKYGVQVDFGAGELKTVADVIRIFEATAASAAASASKKSPGDTP